MSRSMITFLHTVTIIHEVLAPMKVDAYACDCNDPSGNFQVCYFYHNTLIPVDESMVHVLPFIVEKSPKNCSFSLLKDHHENSKKHYDISVEMQPDFITITSHTNQPKDAILAENTKN